jgi:ABC-type sugar transport system substrate-binding protein
MTQPNPAFLTYFYSALSLMTSMMKCFICCSNCSEIAFIGADNKASGIQMGQAISKLLKGRGMILVESGMSQMSILVWKAKGLSRYALTFGMMPEIEKAIRNGQITSAVSQNEREWGLRIVESLYQAKGGQELLPFIDMGYSLIQIDDGVLEL